MIINKESGISLIQKNFTDVNFKQELVPSFISAVWQFAETEVSKGKGIDEIDMGGYKWVYLADQNLLFVFVAEPSDRISWLKKQLAHIKNEFYKLYPELKENQKAVLQSWMGNREKWMAFENVVEDLVKSWDSAGKISIKARAIDILEVYEKIMNPLIFKLPETAQREFIEEVNKLAKSKKIDFNSSMPLLDFIGLGLKGYGYMKIRNFIMDVFDTLFKILNKYFTREDLWRLLSREIYPTIVNEWKRIRTYGLDYNIIKNVLL